MIDFEKMKGKSAKFSIGTKEQLQQMSKILSKVEFYIDGESGMLYMVPVEDEDINRGIKELLDF